MPLPLAELHVHLEGTAPPELVSRIARRNGVDLPERLLGDDGRFRYTATSLFNQRHLKVYRAARRRDVRMPLRF